MMMTRAGLVSFLLASACVASAPEGPDRPDDPDSGDPGDGSGSGDSYEWAAGSFGACSGYCGGGLQNRAVACTRSDGAVVSDALCTAPKPPTEQACNQASCTTNNCTPQGSSAVFTAQTPTTGTVPLTVTFNIQRISSFAWDIVDFGDGTTSQGTPLAVSGIFACVTHTYTRAGAFSAGRSLVGGDPAFYPKRELTVVVQ
jgi:hypothetical protein